MNSIFESICQAMHRCKTVQRVLQTAIGVCMAAGCAALPAHTITPSKSALVATHDTYTLPSPTAKGRIQLAWDDPHNVSRGMRSYYLYYWQTDWDKPKRIDVGPHTTYTLQNLDAGRLYTFAVTVHDGKGNRESKFSNQVSHRIPADTMHGIASLTVPAPGVLTNDHGRNGTSLTVRLVDGPSSGAVTLRADGGFTYVPDATFRDSDRFTYQVSDGTLTSNVATVTLRRTPPIGKPRAALSSLLLIHPHS